MRPLRVGLTGSIAMGKSTLAQHLRHLGFTVFDTNPTPHALEQNPLDTIPPQAQTPQTEDQKIYPLPHPSHRISIQQDPDQDLQDQDLQDQDLQDLNPNQDLQDQDLQNVNPDQDLHVDLFLFFEVPLLFETRAERYMDFTVVVSAAAEEQRRRVMARGAVALQAFERMRHIHMPDEEKRRRADFIVLTDHRSFAPARAQLAQALTEMVGRRRALLDRWMWHVPHVPVSQNGDGRIGDGWKGEDAGDVLIRERFDLVVFDLDDTLVPTFGPVSAGNEVLMEYLRSVVSAEAVEEVGRDLRKVSKAVAEEMPMLRHDRTQVKWEALQRILGKYGATSEVINTAIETSLKGALCGIFVYDQAT